MIANESWSIWSLLPRHIVKGKLISPERLVPLFPGIAKKKGPSPIMPFHNWIFKKLIRPANEVFWNRAQLLLLETPIGSSHYRLTHFYKISGRLSQGLARSEPRPRFHAWYLIEHPELKYTSPIIIRSLLPPFQLSASNDLVRLSHILQGTIQTLYPHPKLLFFWYFLKAQKYSVSCWQR